MKLKSLVWTLGLRPAPRTYGTTRLQFSLERDGVIEFEKWLHPKDQFAPFEQAYLDSLRKYVGEGDTVLDIGAHCGDFTVPLAIAAGPTGQVFAWEPNPYVFEVLKKNAALNQDKTRIVPVCAAVAPEEGELLFHYSDPGFSNGGNLAGVSRWAHGHAFELKVQGLNFERWAQSNYPESLSKLRFIKCDTEGFDYQILKSLEPILKATTPFLHVEYFRHVSPEGRRELWNYLDSLGYDQFTTDGAYGVEPVERVHLTDVTRIEHFDVVCIPRSSAIA